MPSVTLIRDDSSEFAYTSKYTAAAISKMPGKFVEEFWGAENEYLGFERLQKRLKDGKATCAAFSDYVKQRAHIEAEYGKALLKLAKGAGGERETGTLRMAWDGLIRETEKIGQAHLELSSGLVNQLEVACREFRATQRDARKKSEDIVIRLQKNRTSAKDKVNKCKKTYIEKCKEDERLSQHMPAVHQLAAKEAEKLQNKARKAKAEANKADISYQESVRQLENIRVEWENATEAAYEKFQTLEEERIDYLRNNMWALTNFLSSSCVHDDEAYERVRQGLEQCTVTKDIEEFIEINKTGTERPRFIDYESYYGGGGILEDTTQHSAPQSQMVTARSRAGSTTQMTTWQPQPQPLDQWQPTYEDPQQTRAALFKVRALYSYDAQGEEELSFREGDIITIVNQDDEAWWEGTLDGRAGMLPVPYVERV
eukprot:Colp12_sorted_trinity150504_noHs@29259